MISKHFSKFASNMFAILNLKFLKIKVEIHLHIHFGANTQIVYQGETHFLFNYFTRTADEKRKQFRGEMRQEATLISVWE